MGTIFMRQFQLTDLSDNHNKVWKITVFDNGTFQTQWGRVGAALQSKTKPGGMLEANQLIAEKKAKGYREVSLAQATVVVDSTGVNLDAKVEGFIAWILAAANEAIDNFLSVSIDAISTEQIAAGRKFLNDVKKGIANRNSWITRKAVQDFYNAIPTKLPARINPDALVKDFTDKLTEISDRLDQLEAAVKSQQQTVVKSTGSLQDSLGAKVESLDASSAEFQSIASRVRSECIHGYNVKVTEVYKITSNTDRPRYDACSKGASKVRSLWHGTRLANVRHILRSGLIVPQVAVTGRMFGDGVYTAPAFSKSANYCESHQSKQAILLADVKVGKEYKAPASCSSCPSGYDSTLGVGGYTQFYAGSGSTLRNDEVIVYDPAQVTITHVVVFERVS